MPQPTPLPAPQLPGLTLTGLLGQGGMGQVWDGVHTSSGQRVAVKVLRGEQANHLRAFQAEVRAIARMDHPGILAVFDHGTWDGRPYLIMDRAAGPMEPFIPDWAALRGILMSVLDALAHAHARGVLHLDIKPSNILVGSDGKLKLADFGLAWLSSLQQKLVAGSPPYMPPEQLSGDWRNLGPWSDLYAVGCMAALFATGSPLFAGLPVQQLRKLRAAAPPPLALISAGAPGGLEAWIHRLLQPQPQDRFQTAADAAWALLSLGRGSTQRSRPILQTFAAQTETGSATVWGDQPWEPPPPPSAASALPPIQRAPIPTDWRAPRIQRPPISGLGLSLYALRERQTFGRADAQDALWAALHAARQQRRPQLVIIRGPAGIGKSQLARWLCGRASDVGAAEPLVVTASAHKPLDDTLRAALADQLGCTGLDGAELRAQLRRRLPELAGEPLDTFARHLDGTTPPRPALVPLARAAHRRTTLLWLEDVHLDEAAFTLARFLLQQRGDDLPVLIVMTARDEALALTPRLQRALGALARHERAQTVSLGPLSPTAMRALIQERLDLQPALASTIEARVAGNPQLTVQLLVDWIERGLLHHTPEGFRLTGEMPPMPEHLAEIWQDRIARLLAPRAPEEGIALERAAVLGVQVSEEEWRAACQQTGVPCPLSLLDEMLRQDLAESLDSGQWRFSNTMLREALLDRARAAERLVDHHRAAAQALQHPKGRAFGRVGMHLAGAGAHADALPPLMEAVEVSLGHSKDVEVERLLAQARASLAEADLADDDPQQGRFRELALQYQIRHQDPAAIEAAQALLADCRRLGWGELGQRVRFQLSRAHILVSNSERGAEILEQMLQEDAQAPLDRTLFALVVMHLGHRRMIENKHPEAAALFQRGLSESDKFRVPLLQQLGFAQMYQDQLDEAERTFRQTRALAREQGRDASLMNCDYGLGQLYFERGDLDAAEAAFRQSYQRGLSIGAVARWRSHLELAHLHLLRSEYQQARAITEQEAPNIGTSAHWLKRVAAFRLLSAAGLGLGAAWDEAWVAVRAQFGVPPAPNTANQELLQRTRAALLQRNDRGRVSLLDAWLDA